MLALKAGLWAVACRKSEGAQTKPCRCSDDSRESDTLGREGGLKVCITDIVLMSKGGVGVVEFVDMESGLSELVCFGVPG